MEGTYLKWGSVALVLLAMVVMYTLFDPSTTSYFPSCPSRKLTGLKCPGCGSQRAMHHLLNFEFSNALEDNALMVIAIPYILTGFFFDLKKDKGPKMLVWRKRLFGIKAIYIVLTLIISFWILRNLPFFQDIL